MLTQPAVWAIIINNFTFHYAFYVVMNWLPTYFDKVCTLSTHYTYLRHGAAASGSADNGAGTVFDTMHTISPQPPNVSDDDVYSI